MSPWRPSPTPTRTGSSSWTVTPPSAPDEPEYHSAQELIADSEALSNVTAVQEDNIILFPNNFYVTEDIEAYTEVLNTIADAFEDAAE